MERTFTTFEIVKILHIERNLLAQWLMKGYITPSIQRAKGVGSKNIFSRNDLYNIRLFQQLVNTGIRRREAEMYIDINFRNIGEAETDLKYIIYTRKMKRVGIDEGIITDMEMVAYPPRIIFKDDDSYVVVINLLGIKKEVDRMIGE
jgi:hypothetical protein